MNCKQSSTILLVGVGPHSRRVYLPALLQNTLQLNSIIGIDLHSQKDVIETYLEAKGWKNSVRMYYIDAFDPQISELPAELASFLDDLCQEHAIKAVIIATEPLVHVHYGLWALNHDNLHVLMDKPISTKYNAAESILAGRSILNDYERLYAAYSLRGMKTLFSVNCQRRYHTGFQFVLQCIREVSAKFHQPVSMVQSFHSDGQLRLHDEICTQTYHSYNQGHGKLSHSGYHFFDFLNQIYGAGEVCGKEPNSLEIVSSFVKPAGLLHQQNQEDFQRVWPDLKVKRSDEQLREEYAFGYGEVDANVQIVFTKDGENVSLASLSAAHNGFTKRHWPAPGADLYKGNGRVKHEMHIIEQGPYQAIHVFCFQSDDKHDQQHADGIDPSDIGGHDHFEVHLYRSTDLFKNKDQPTLQKFNLKDIIEKVQNIADLGHCGETQSSIFNLSGEASKQSVVQEFLFVASGQMSVSKALSNLPSHRLGVQLLSASYTSAAKQLLRMNPIVSVPISPLHATINNGPILSLAKGLLDGGCKYWINFPGFRSHDITAALNTLRPTQDPTFTDSFPVDVNNLHTAINEKVAFEMAYGASLAGHRSLVTFKNYGLNVAADPFLNSLLTGVRSGLVVIVTDDVDVAGSQGRADSRFYREFNGGGLWLEPSSLAQAYHFGRMTFEWSETLDIPVVIRLTNGFFNLNDVVQLENGIRSPQTEPNLDDPYRYHNPLKFVNHPTTWRNLYDNLKVKTDRISRFVSDEIYDNEAIRSKLGLVIVTTSTNKKIAVCCGATSENALMSVGSSDLFSVVTYPMPMKMLRNFIEKYEEVLVLENGEDYVRKQLLLDSFEARGVGNHIQTVDIPLPDHSANYITWPFLERLFSALRAVAFTDTSLLGLTPCSVVGDLGQYTSETTGTISSCLCLGSSVSVALGMALTGNVFPFCITGDAALVHAGVGILSEVKLRSASMCIVIIDNSGSASTGGQMPVTGLQIPGSINETKIIYARTTKQTFIKILSDARKRSGSPTVLRVIV